MSVYCCCCQLLASLLLALHVQKPIAAAILFTILRLQTPHPFKVWVSCHSIITTVVCRFTHIFLSSLITGCSRNVLLTVDYNCNTEGVDISVLAVGDTNDYQQLTVLHLIGYRPPSDTDCGGADRFRCKDHLVVKDTTLNSTTIFVPLQDALLLVEFISNDTHLNMQEYHLINLTRFNCSPVASFKIFRSVYTVCLNIEQSFLGLFEVRLNLDYLTRTIILGPLAGTNYFNSIEGPSLSEFVYVELYHFHFIYFTYENHLYYFEPLEYYLQYSGALHRNCSSVKELVYIGDDILTVHCTRPDATLYYNLVYEYWTHYQLYSDYGRPYVCPDLNTQLKVYQSSGFIEIQQSTAMDEDDNNRFELAGENFVLGECFGDSGSYHFVYVDQIEGTFVFDLITFNFTRLTMQSCYNIDNGNSCNPVYRLLDNHRVFIQESDNNQDDADLLKVFDVRNKIWTITELSGVNKSLNLVTVLDEGTTNACVVPSTDSSPIYTTMSIKTYTDPVTIQKFGNISSTSQPLNSEDTDLIVIGVLSAMLLLVCLLLVATVVIILVFTITRWRIENRYVIIMHKSACTTIYNACSVMILL